tara:strand:+ start:156 stop:497 length:342 start_codon:yes stop_codon:yes gene_type:complete
MLNKKVSLIILSASIILFSCANMPTPTAQIVGTYTSDLKYKDFSCEDLAKELNNLARRESQLVVAQEQRIKTSKQQAFWLGYGQGDGVEASELAVVRGEKNAVRDAIANKECN